MRKIVAAMKDGHARAKLAFEIFIHRLQTGIGAMIAALNGIDALIFTGGIGENSPEVRDANCGNFGFLGMALDSGRNLEIAGEGVADVEISTTESRVRVLVVQAQEDWAIARECWRVKREKAADHKISMGRPT